jgi:hypothetical protein
LEGEAGANISRVLSFLFGALLMFHFFWEDFSDLRPKLCCTVLVLIASAHYILLCIVLKFVLLPLVKGSSKGILYFFGGGLQF